MKKNNFHQTGSFKGFGGVNLYYQQWIPQKPCRGILIFIHGISEHSDRYHFPADYFSKRGFRIYAMDLRGHGHSEGRRVYVDRWENLIDDIHCFVKKVKKECPKKRVFLIGHSFGGQLVLNYGVHFPKSVHGLLLSSPNIRLQVRVSLIKRLFAPLLSLIFPSLTLGNDIDPSMVSRNPQVIEEYRNDRRIVRKITARLGDLVLSNQLKIMDLATQLRVPCFLMHAGADQICSPKGTEEFFQKVPVRDKQLKIYDGFYHELFNEVERGVVFRDMEKWIGNRL